MLAAEGPLPCWKTLPSAGAGGQFIGALGSAVNKAIDTLVPIIVKADVEPKLRQRWLERLWQALQDDEMPYIERLGDYWGELCVTPELASRWADEFCRSSKACGARLHRGHGFFKGTSACLSIDCTRRVVMTICWR